MYKTALLTFIGAACFVAWAFMAYKDPTLQPDFLTFVKTTLVGVIALVLRDLPTPKE